MRGALAVGSTLALALALALAGCGGGAPRERGVRDAVQRYLAALTHGDPAAACAELTPATRERLAEFGGERLRLRRRSCPGTIASLLRSPAGAGLRRLRGARIVSVERHGDRAKAHVERFDAPTLLVREAGTWRIESAPSGETD